MLALVTACGGGLRATGPETLTTIADAGLHPASRCGTDADCPTGMLCEACADGFQTCVPGCRDDAQCGPYQRCFHNVQCATCPCPSGWCDLDPCRDFDGDGYTPATDLECPGRKLGDCNDQAPWANPGQAERCANGVDDDCDGQVDSRDDDCAASCASGSTRRCSVPSNCGWQSTCEAGCCEACPRHLDPVCGANECLLPGGTGADGCFLPSVCGACTGCPQTSAPVCGTNYATYTNACLAQAAGAQVLHDGECAYREGHRCQHDVDCAGGNLFCRELAGGEGRCSKVGTCSTDADCERITSVVPCGDAGIAPWTCVAQRCSARCQ